MSTVKANDLMKVDGGIPTVKGQKLIPTAWVNFNGSGTVAIRDSEGISSITDVKVGGFTLNFTTTMANSNYAVVGTSKNECQANGAVVVHFPSCTAATTSAAPLIITRVDAAASSNSYIDATNITVIVAGGQS